MQPDNSVPFPVGSFPQPVPVPQPDPDSDPLVHVDFAASWLPLVIGSLLQLLEQPTWDTSDPTALHTAQLQANTLIAIFQESIPVYPPGLISYFAGATPPTGWLQCDGSAVSRTTYASLFAITGTTYGPGDGSTTFNLPDLRGRSPIGVGQQSGGTNFALGATGGEETHTLITAEIPSHTHTDAGHFHAVSNFLLTGTSVPPPLDAGTEVPHLTAFSGSASANIQNTGGDGAHNNIEPYQVLLPIIKF